jgi:hypothetical protein
MKGICYVLSKSYDCFVDISALVPVFPEARLFKAREGIKRVSLEQIVKQYWLPDTTKKLFYHAKKSKGVISLDVVRKEIVVNGSRFSPPALLNAPCGFRTNLCQSEKESTIPAPATQHLFNLFVAGSLKRIYFQKLWNDSVLTTTKNRALTSV